MNSPGHEGLHMTGTCLFPHRKQGEETAYQQGVLVVSLVGNEVTVTRLDVLFRGGEA